MKEKYYSTLTSSMMIALATLCLYGENAAHDVPENDNVMAISPMPSSTSFIS